ncbi:opioid growth factor receptor-like isoform X2 [Petromyzon marinus]|uniref:opioid growth factor receptor-like isoform X2 n=1 Tax=Petromyzon marinus TaxID=7757 RepID=UPI003F71E711
MGNAPSDGRNGQARTLTITDYDTTWESESETESQPRDEKSGVRGEGDSAGSRLSRAVADDNAAPHAAPAATSAVSVLSTRPKRSLYAARDMHQYRHGYPKMRESPTVQNRLMRAYEMMLDTYGLRLDDRERGTIRRADHFHQRLRDVFKDETSQHHNMRLTRVLKSLGELGLEHYKAPLVRALLRIALSPACPQAAAHMRRSALDYFVFTVRDRGERRRLLLYAQAKYRPEDEFVWGPPVGRLTRYAHLVTPDSDESDREVESNEENEPARDCQGEELLERICDASTEDVHQHAPQSDAGYDDIS